MRSAFDGAKAFASLAILYQDVPPPRALPKCTLYLVTLRENKHLAFPPRTAGDQLVLQGLLLRFEGFAFRPQNQTELTEKISYEKHPLNRSA